MADTADLRRILEAINAAWTTAQTESLHSVFHPEMVIAGPGYQQFAAGRNACVESYREFSANAEVLAYSIDILVRNAG